MACALAGRARLCRIGTNTCAAGVGRGPSQRTRPRAAPAPVASRHLRRIPFVFRLLRVPSASARGLGTVPAFVPPERDTNPMLEPKPKAIPSSTGDHHDHADHQGPVLRRNSRQQAHARRARRHRLHAVRRRLQPGKAVARQEHHRRAGDRADAVRDQPERQRLGLPGPRQVERAHRSERQQQHLRLSRRARQIQTLTTDTGDHHDHADHPGPVRR
ncbi:hypothetical protein CBM2623_A220022 [Cupriavidus taiwanensis]|nr:hypothetical protein CBM2608_A210020 [Cupriavidus taiwanensis]SPA27193.1 hypothetical protein CBM2623_A220022 [Cupriavidus taiwanensis]SPA44898.1 hypothetical protein CBM2629_A170125 [Cupriavidus taiwanensis]